jgi:hypothetical protein
MTLEALMADEERPDPRPVALRHAWGPEFGASAKAWREERERSEPRRPNHPFVEIDRRPNGADRAEELPPLWIVSPADLKGYPPPREWNVDDWLPCGVVTGLYGEGGLGKSLLALQLQTSMATNKPWLGLSVMQGPSLGVYYEDDHNERTSLFQGQCQSAGPSRSSSSFSSTGF